MDIDNNVGGVALACPFCGKTDTVSAIIKHYKSDWDGWRWVAYVECWVCIVKGPHVGSSFGEKTQESALREAVDLWNTRHANSLLDRNDPPNTGGEPGYATGDCSASFDVLIREGQKYANCPACGTLWTPEEWPTLCEFSNPDSMPTGPHCPRCRAVVKIFVEQNAELTGSKQPGKGLT